MTGKESRGVGEILSTEYKRGVHPVAEQAISRRRLTRRLQRLGQVLSEFDPNKQEEDSKKMSNSFERKICRECNGHGEVDGDPCPKCGGTGLAEHKDDRIHPRGKEVPKSPKVLR